MHTHTRQHLMWVKKILQNFQDKNECSIVLGKLDEMF